MRKNTVKKVSRILTATMVLSTMLNNFSLSAIADTRKVDVWDFSEKQEENTDVYNNVPTVSTLASSALNEKINYTFGELSYFSNGNDSIYSKSATYEDGYSATTGLYGNGTATASRRYLTMQNVKAGDTIRIYGYVSVADIINFINTTTGTTEQMNIATSPTILNYIAKEDGTYKIYTGTSGKPTYNKVLRIPAVNVSGSFTNKSDVSIADGTTVTFSGVENNHRVTAEIVNNSYSAMLPVGTYNAKINLADAKVSLDTREITVGDSESVTAGVTKDFTIENQILYKLSGNITGFSSDYDLSKFVLKFNPPEDSMSDVVQAEFNSADSTFSANIEPEVEYTAELNGVNDYNLAQDYKFSVSNKDDVQNIAVEPKAVYEVNGGFLKLPSNESITSIKFINIEDDYEYSGTLSSNGFDVKLRNGSYSVAVGSTNYSVPTHIVVDGKNVTKDIMFKPTANTVTPVEWSADVYVGYNDKSNNYNTVTEAVKAVKGMNPQSEAQRVTIHIAPGVYREQVIIEAPYITLVNDEPEKGEAKITWYYGIGYGYYSAGADGFYNEYDAYDKFETKKVDRWGCTVRVKSTATDFRAENIVFENSFNRYVTEEELTDGVELRNDLYTDSTQKTLRTKYTDVTTKAATERAAAMEVDGDRSEFYNCEFLSSQDTLYTNINTNQYFKNCLIEGNTDYIFGTGSVVFDGCELSFYGYKETASTAYITANSFDPTKENSNGYIFRNCTITQNPELMSAPSYFGRPWGAKAKTVFLNTKLDSNNAIIADGWSDWSSKLAKDANYKEFNTTFNGEAVSTASRPEGTVLSQAESYNDVAANLGFTPYYYANESATAPVFSINPALLSDDDINSPKTGDTLAIAYEFASEADKANDGSTISWFRVDESGKETLIKTLGAYVDGAKQYKLSSDDIGYHIKASVMAESISGLKGETKSSVTEFKVIKGSQSGDIDLPTDGVNIYIAGDSTVKSYLTAEDKGGWGEFLQDYFNKDYVNVVNYANGGRSTRNFINEGSLDKIKQNIKAGDYFLIQFGHNDCANQESYLLDRHVSVGTPDENGIYPTTAAEKTTTPDSYASKYGDTYYPYSSGTFKWYLKQYIDTAKAVGATPILVTPVSRRNFDSNGNINPHHDSTDTTTDTVTSSNNAYVKAMIQLAQEENIEVIDLFEITKNDLEAAYKESGDLSVVNGVFTASDGTHYNKVGAAIQAADIAKEIMNMNLTISPTVIKPNNVGGLGPDGVVQFEVDKNNVATAFTANDYKEVNTYWTKVFQDAIDELVYKGPDVTGDEYLVGDVNFDKYVNSADAVLIIKSCIDSDASFENDSILKVVANVDGDNYINSTDAALVIKADIDASFKFPVGEKITIAA